jgi:nucleoside-diphosphate-sugar epimerase
MEMQMSGTIVVLGYGASGRATVEALAARGDRVRVAQRSKPKDLPPGVEFCSCDALDAAAVRRAFEGATQVVLAVGFAYDRRVWRKVWVPTMTNVLAACAATGARLVFVDNLYQLGPQNAPRTEDMPLWDHGAKPAILCQVTRLWMAARDRVKVAALRCTDFYGPGVAASHIGPQALGAVAQGKSAMMIAPPDTPHDFSYVPDIARAVLTLLDAPDDAYGQVWNMPCAPTRTPREILQMGAQAMGVKLRVRAIPFWLLRVMGLFVPFMREVADVRFTFDRPYVVDGSKFTKRFGFEVTPFEDGVRATVRSYASMRQQIG